MRSIDPRDFRVARRGTSRAINRQIVLTLVRTHQPISRADLARLMKVRRGAVGLLINELIAEGLVFEGAKGQTRRGRRPKFLHIDSRERYVLAVDIRITRTFVMVADLVGRPLREVTSFPTPRTPPELVRELAQRLLAIVAEQGAGRCQGVGVAVPGVVDETTRRVRHAPTLGWKDVVILEPLAAATRLPVFVENSGKACALSQTWSSQADAKGDIVFVTISDGVGVGVVVNGELLRGRHNIAGEFGHVPLSIEGPRCSCGATGCWEAYVSNLATLSRYLGQTVDQEKSAPGSAVSLTVEDLIERARGGDARAMDTLQSTGRYLGLGLASIINAIDPVRVFLSGEITAAWDLLEGVVRAGVAERALNPSGSDTEIVVVPPQEYPRLRGAATLVVMPTFAAPAIA
jgi:predicted NBD/HSP70 family sugar kinase